MNITSTMLNRIFIELSLRGGNSAVSDYFMCLTSKLARRFSWQAYWRIEGCYPGIFRFCRRFFPLSAHSSNFLIPCCKALVCL